MEKVLETVVDNSKPYKMILQWFKLERIVTLTDVIVMEDVRSA